MIRRGGFLLAALATFAPAFASSPDRWFTGSSAHGFTGAPAVLVASTQTPAATGQRAETQGPSDEGIPVTDPVVVRACGSCHTRDDKQRMTRISDRSATPENWELTVRRMMSLNNVQLTPETARAVIKSLVRLARSCSRRSAAGHVRGRASSHRFHLRGRQGHRTRCAAAVIRWVASSANAGRETSGPGLLRCTGTTTRASTAPRAGSVAEALRPAARGCGGAADAQGIRRGRGADDSQPMDKARECSPRNLPLMSADGPAWSAAMRTPKLAGRWAISGYEIGKGPVYGQLTIVERPGVADGFTTEARFTVQPDGQTVTRNSRAIVYTGFQWRGRSADTPNDPARAQGGLHPTSGPGGHGPMVHGRVRRNRDRRHPAQGGNRSCCQQYVMVER